MGSDKGLLKRALSSSHNGKLIIDKAGEIVFANEKARKVLGLAGEKILRRFYNDSEWGIADQNGEPFPDEKLPFARVMRTGEMVHGFVQSICRPDGSRVYVSVNGTPVFDEMGNVSGGIFDFKKIKDEGSAFEDGDKK
jgi:PAS domain S-box-containing protein